MANTFRARIITPSETVFHGMVSSIIVPAETGYLGVLANHAPLAANIVSGKITLREDSGKTAIFYSKGEGFLEVLENNATLLLDSVTT
ncbi:MAG: hypothetical protein PHE61_06460 [Candidatus Omnitrophica bacterium]|nr:hypothetical protein [Candidatus Omnitrophota bacterium]